MSKRVVKTTFRLFGEEIRQALADKKRVSPDMAVESADADKPGES
jgi:hypothetical protein